MLYLNFSKANAKLAKLQTLLGKRVYSFDTLSGGENCPYAKECQSQVVFNGEAFRIQDGIHTKFRCFSASQEVLFPAVRNARLQNSQLRMIAAESVDKMVETVLFQLPANCEVLRIHVAGDMSTQNYFDGWIKVAQSRPDVIFYAYTKSLPFWVKRLGEIPHNLRLTASFGGWKDELIEKHNLPYAKVIFSEDMACGLPIDHDDSHAYNGGNSFALLLHGVQPKDTEAARALKVLKGNGSYSRGVVNA